MIKMGDMSRAFLNEIKIIYRSKSMIFLTIVVPILLMLILGYIFPSMLNPQNYRIAVYNEDNGEYSNIILTLVYSMLKGENFELIKSADVLNKGLNDGTFDGAILIPKGFSKNVQESNMFTLDFIPSAANIQTSVVIYQALNTVLSEIGNGVMIYNILELYKKPANKIPIAPPKMTFQGPSGANMNYVDFMIPGIAALIAIVSIAITLSSSVSYEREKGILNGIITSGVNRPLHALGKIFAYTLNGMINGTIALITAQIYFSSGLDAPLRTLLLLALGSFAFAGFGIIVSTLSPSQKLSGFIVIGYVLPTIFLSGLFIPIDQMPKIAQLFSKAFPLTFMADAMQRINILNYSIFQLSQDTIPLLIYSAISVSIALIVFSKIEKIEEVV